mgnify:CR=1 FL=1
MSQPEKRLYRSRSNRMLAGVCGGLAEFFSLDVSLVRLGFVVGVILGAGSLAVVYLIMLIVVPEEPQSAVPVPPVEQQQQ